jgi:hypothetical protein
MGVVNFHSFQEQVELLFGGGHLTTKYLICLRDSRENFEDETKIVHLGVVWTGI